MVPLWRDLPSVLFVYVLNLYAAHPITKAICSSHKLPTGYFPYACEHLFLKKLQGCVSLKGTLTTFKFLMFCFFSFNGGVPHPVAVAHAGACVQLNLCERRASRQLHTYVLACCSCKLSCTRVYRSHLHPTQFHSFPSWVKPQRWVTTSLMHCPPEVE